MRDKKLSGFTPNYRRDIDGLRAVAVAAVVLYHAFPTYLVGGFIGVDIFFVISGYLISSIIFQNLSNSSFSFVDFYARRVRRIFPALITVLISTLVLGWYTLLPEEYAPLGKHVLAGAAFVENLVLWSESGYFDVAAQTKPLLHLWSLGIEEQFYLIWPVFLAVLWRFKSRPLAVIASVTAISFLYNTVHVHPNQTSTFYSIVTRLWELSFGAVGAWICLNKNSRWFDFKRIMDHGLSWFFFLNERTGSHVSNQLASLAGSVLIGAGLYISSDVRYFPGWAALLPVLGALALLMAGEKAWINRYILGNGLLVALGLISYPLYLWHWPLLTIARIVSGRDLDIHSRWVIVGIALVLAILTYFLVERPVRHARKLRKTALWLTVAMCLVAAAGGWAWYSDGIPQRKEISKFADNNAELTKPPFNDDACIKYMGYEKMRPCDCRFRDAGGTETVALLGDSHAYAAFTGVADYLAAKGINTLSLAPSSPILDDVWDNHSERVPASETGVYKIIAQILPKKDIKKVFLFSRGAMYLTGVPLRPQEGPPRVRPTIQPAAMEMGFQDSINMLNAGGKKVYFVTENPDWAYNPSICIHRPYRQAEIDCTQPLAEVRARQATFFGILSRLKGVTLIDTLPDFCPNGTCSVMEDGRLLYMDDDHLSVSGSRFQANHSLAPYLTDTK